MWGVAWWAALRTFEGAAVPYDAKLACGKLAYVGIVSIPPLWLMAALSYCGLDQWLTRRRLIGLWVIPAITLALALTPSAHDISAVFLSR